MSFQFGGGAQQQPSQPMGGFAFSQPQQDLSKGFGFGATQPSGFNVANPATTTGQSGGFKFGAPALGAGATAAPGSLGSFSFGAPTTSNTGFSFGQPAAAPAASTAFSMGVTPAAATTATSAFAFGAPAASAPAPSFGFGAAAATTANTGFAFGAPATSQPAPAFGFGAAPAAQPAGGFSFGTAPAQTPGGFAFGNTPAASTAPATGFGFGAATTTTASQFGFGNAPQSAAPSFGFGSTPAGGAFGTAASTGAFGVPATTTTSAFGLQQLPTTTTIGAFGIQSTTSAFGMPAAAPTTTAGSFGMAPAGGTGAFGLSTAPAATPFGSLAPTNMVAPTGFGTSTAPPAPSTVPFGGAPAPTTGFNFGTTVTTSTETTATPFSNAGLTFGTAKTASVAPNNSGNLLQPQASVISTASTLPFGATATQSSTNLPTVTSTPGFSIGNIPSTKPEAKDATKPFSFGVGTGITAISTPSSTVTSMATPSLSFAPTATSTPGAAATTIGFSIPTSKPTTSASFPATTTLLPSTISSGLMFGQATTSVPISTVSTAVTSAVLSTSTTVTSSAATPATINFRQLEDIINKGKIELEEQEKIFLNQATQVNAWDRLLISNGEKITVLSDAVERVKLDQQRLDLELDFILAQQSELEELISPLEKNLEMTPNTNIQQHADLEREHTYHLAESIDAQLKRMSEDIREIIEHVNASNNVQDDNDPVQQIAKILNAHMDALQWIEQSTVALQRKFEGTSKMYETQKREQEKSFKNAFA